MRISLVVITLNEERRLGAALESAREVVDEMLVCDSLSADGTVDLARSLGARVVSRAFEGYADQRNHAAQRTAHPWILALDADERLSVELRAEIQRLRSSEPECAAFSMPRRSHYLGRWIRHSGWYPDRKPRLYRRGLAEWTGASVHERLRVQGEVRPLRGDLLHFGYENLEQHLDRIPRYARLAARERYARGERFSGLRCCLEPLARGLRGYLLRGGFLDGVPGFFIAALTAYGILLRQAFLWELQRREATGPPPPR